MNRPQDWAAQKSWLEKNFGEVCTYWHGPKHYSSSIARPCLLLSDGLFASTVIGTGTSGPDSITALFNAITGHGPAHHIKTGEKRVTVDAQTLQIRPLQM